MNPSTHIPTDRLARSRRPRRFDAHVEHALFAVTLAIGCLAAISFLVGAV